jgi:hypothetical protein
MWLRQSGFEKFGGHKKGLLRGSGDWPELTEDERVLVGLTEEQEMRAIEIARDHPLVQEFLDKRAIIDEAEPPQAIRYEDGKRILYLPYGLDKAGVWFWYQDEFTTTWEVLVNLVEERVVRIEETVVGICRETKTPIKEERVIYP